MLTILALSIAGICWANVDVVIEPQSGESPAGAPGLIASDSDFFFLYMAQSTLPVPGIGTGVFAKLDIPAGELICEYRGQIGEPSFDPYSDKLVSIRVEGNLLSISGNTICAYINDCAWIYNNSFTVADIDYFMRLQKEDSIPTYPGFEYNAIGIATKMGKIFIQSTKDIKAGSEICYPYGRKYWKHNLRERALSKRASILNAFYRSKTLNLSLLPESADFSIGFYN
jgi:hypothetical protein